MSKNKDIGEKKLKRGPNNRSLLLVYRTVEKSPFSDQYRQTNKSQRRVVYRIKLRLMYCGFFAVGYEKSHRIYDPYKCDYKDVYDDDILCLYQRNIIEFRSD